MAIKTMARKGVSPSKNFTKVLKKDMKSDLKIIKKSK